MRIHVHNRLDTERKRISSGFRFTYRFLKLIGDSLRHCWAAPVFLLCCLLITSGFYEYVAYQMGLVASQFYGALTTQSYTRFIWTVKLSVVYVFGISVIKAVLNLLSGHLSVYLRQSLTTRLHGRYFQRKNYYTIINLVDIDNPDQRFTQDIDVTCNILSEIIPTLLINPILVVFYTYKCVDKAGWLGPLSAYLLFIVFAILTHLLTTWTSAAVYEQERQEGNFRFLHAQFRCDSESAAFLDLGQSEHCFARSAFERLLHAFRVKVNRKPVLLCVTELSAYTGAVLNYLTIGVVLFGGLFGDLTTSEVTVLISQTSFFLLYLINKLTTLIALANSIAQLVGVGHRLITLNHCLLEATGHITPGSYAASKFPIVQLIRPTSVKPSVDNAGGDAFSDEWMKASDVAIQLDHISISLPTNPKLILIHDLSIQISLQEPLLITGPSGVGKTALLRVLAELWPARSFNKGYFYRNANVRIVYVPQKPFVPSAYACPSRLFNVLLDDDRADFRTPNSDSGYRALHLAYLLLSVAQVPCSELSAYSLPTDAIRSQITVSGDLDSRSGYPRTHVMWCGYPTTAYADALNLLCEFRLIDSEQVKLVSERLERLATMSSMSTSSSSVAKLGTFVRDTIRFGCQPVIRDFDLAAGEWRNCYSPGEMQRLVLAVVCYQRPHLAFLDEATSQLSESDEAQAYASLRLRSITPVTVGHRPSVRVYHERELRLVPYDSNNNHGEVPDAIRGAGHSNRMAQVGQLEEKLNWELLSL